MTREEALKAITAFVENYACGSDLDGLREAIEALKERPHGEWIFHKYDKDYECSNCHVRFDRTQIYTEKRFENALWAKMEIYNFCPNCGASMSANDRQVTGKLNEEPKDSHSEYWNSIGEWKEGEAE